ncbi:MAG: acyl carrier protein [Cyclobacteriaceae bacterium]
MSKLKRILKDSFAMTESEFNDHQALGKLRDFDSMNHMLFVTKLEEEFGIELTGDEIVSLETIENIKDLLKAKNIDPLA